MTQQDDITQRLRDNADLDEAEHGNARVVQLEREAADEIERLRAELWQLRAPVAPEPFRAAFANGVLPATRFHELWESAAPSKNSGHTMLEDLTWQVGKFAALVAAEVSAPVADERDIWLVCLSREYYNGGDRPLLAVPTEAMAQQIAADLQQYCRDLRERLDANNWQHEEDPEISSKLYEESEALFAAAQFPHGVKLARYDLDDGFSFWPLVMIGNPAALASAPVADEKPDESNSPVPLTGHSMGPMTPIYDHVGSLIGQALATARHGAYEGSIVWTRMRHAGEWMPWHVAGKQSAPVAGEAIYYAVMHGNALYGIFGTEAAAEACKAQGHPDAPFSVKPLYAAPQASAENVRKPIMTVAEFCTEADRIGLTADTLAAQLAQRPEFADCLPQADKDGGQQRAGDDLINALGQCRDAFPIPDMVGSQLDLLWQEAMSDPTAVPAYVKACAARAALFATQTEQGERDAD